MADWEKNAVKDLREYGCVKESLVNIPAEIHELETALHTIKSVTYDKTPVAGGTSGREDALINNIDRRGRLAENLEVAKSKVARIERGLAVLSDRERRVLDGFFMRRSYGHVERLADELGYEERNIYKIKDEALLKFTLAMFGVRDY